jgi:ATP-dependent DNA helicase RecQ
MAEIKPTSREELLTVSGIGERKADRFGETFLKALADYEP